MGLKPSFPILLLVACLALTLYVAIAPPRTTASNCCQFPTTEQEISGGVSSAQPTEGLFKMVLSDAQGTDFSDDEVGEYSSQAGVDSCWNQARSLGHPLPAADDQIYVTTPEPEYYWDVGEVGTWDGSPGALNTVSPTPQYNTFGYDGVGYSQQEVNYYRVDVPGISIPCGFEIYQGMAMYCPFTFHWAAYAFNDLTADVNAAYVVGCKDSACATIYH